MPEIQNEYPNGDPRATDRSETDSLRHVWSCDCGHEAMDYDEIKHDCPLMDKNPDGEDA